MRTNKFGQSWLDGYAARLKACKGDTVSTAGQVFADIMFESGQPQQPARTQPEPELVLKGEQLVNLRKATELLKALNSRGSAHVNEIDAMIAAGHLSRALEGTAYEFRPVGIAASQDTL